MEKYIDKSIAEAKIILNEAVRKYVLQNALSMINNKTSVYCANEQITYNNCSNCIYYNNEMFKCGNTAKIFDCVK